MTQDELADALSVDRDHISRIERGIRVCSIDLLVELSSLLGVSTDYLLMGKMESKSARQNLIDIAQQLTALAENL